MKLNEVKFSEADITIMKSKVMELVKSGNAEILSSTIKLLHFSNSELKQIQNKVMKLALAGNENLLSILIDKALPDAK